MSSTSVFESSKETSGDFIIFFNEVRPEVQYKLITELEEKRGIKWYLNLKASLIRIGNEGDIEVVTPHFRSITTIELIEDTIEKHLEEGFQKIINSFEEFIQRGSGWSLDKILHLELNCCKYRPLGSG